MKNFILLVLAVLAAAVAGAQDTPKPVARAREKLMQKDRLAAAKTLLAAINDNKREAERSELLKELKNISGVFLTDDGQKSYEMAESLLYSASPGAEAKYEEALAREPYNLQVLLGLARARMAAGDCAGAEKALTEAENVNPYSPERKLLWARANYCLRKVFRKSDDPQSPELKPYFLLLQARALVEDQKYREAQALLFKDAKELADWDMPEVYFWRYKSLAAASAEAIDHAQKYVDQCKALNSVVRRKFRWEPALCAHDRETEEFIKTNEVAR